VTKPKKRKRLRAQDTLRLPIWKTVYTFTAYSNRQISGHADLADVIADCTDGDSIGEAAIIQQQTVDPRCVRRALIKISNDGTFFDREPDEEDR
jgi:hypothetical protein